MKEFLENNKELFIQEVEKLQRGLRGNYSKEQIELIFKKIKAYKVNHLKKTVEHLLSVKTFLPPIGEIEVGCRAESYSDKMEEDKEDRMFAKNFFEGKSKGGEMVKLSIKLITDVLSGVISKHQLYGKMQDMETIYPNIGWGRMSALLMAGVKPKKSD